MGRWLAKLNDAEKNTKAAPEGTDKTDKNPPQAFSSVLSVPHLGNRAIFSGDADDLAIEAEERAGILEYDAGLPRIEEERLAFGRPPTPGITIRAPAIELSAVEYDRHLDGMIQAAGEGTPEASLLAHSKRKGWVVPRGDETVFTRGR